MWVWCVPRLVASDSFTVSVKAIIQKQRIFHCCNGCSFCLHLFISILFKNLFAFSALVSAFQLHPEVLLAVCRTEYVSCYAYTKPISYLKIADRFTCVALWRLVTRIQITANLNHCKVRKSMPVTLPAQTVWRCHIFWPRNSVWFDTTPLESQNEMICQKFG